MEISALEVVDFRNYERAEAEFAPGFNAVVGGNGQGKTNLLEAIYLLSALASHRSSSSAVLVRHDCERGVVRSVGVAGGRRVTLDAEVRREGGVRLLVNKAALGRAQRPAVLAVVLFSPEDLALVKGGPEERRRFLDHAAARMRPAAARERQEFERVLRQRNGVLRALGSNPRLRESLEVWDEQFVRVSTAVVRDRLRVLAGVGAATGRRYREVSGSAEVLGLAYRAAWSDEMPRDEAAIAEELRGALARMRAREVERGVSLAGPHRDDLQITLDGVDARAFASQGEQRSAVVALRLAERDLLSEVRGEDPVLLLDDVFSELDDRRRAQLAELVSGGGQAIATATSPAGLPVAPGRLITVENGKVSTHA